MFHALLKGSVVWARACALAQTSQSPGEAPGVRRSVSMPLRKEVGKIAPVIYPQVSMCCSALVLGALVLPQCALTWGGRRIWSLPFICWPVHAYSPPPLTEHLPCVTQSQWEDPDNVVCMEMRNCPEFTVEAAAFSGKESNPYQRNPQVQAFPLSWILR